MCRTFARQRLRDTKTKTSVLLSCILLPFSPPFKAPPLPPHPSSSKHSVEGARLAPSAGNRPQDEGSAILRWNQRHPKRQVRPGLAILEVNGCCSTAEMPHGWRWMECFHREGRRVAGQDADGKGVLWRSRSASTVEMVRKRQKWTSSGSRVEVIYAVPFAIWNPLKTVFHAF